MATIREIIDDVDRLKPNAYSDAVKVGWISDIDEKVKANNIKTFSFFDIQRIEGQTSYDIPLGVNFEDIETVFFDSIPVTKIDFRSYLETGYYLENGKFAIYPAPTRTDESSAPGIRVIYIQNLNRYRSVEYISGADQISFEHNQIITSANNFSNFVIGDTVAVTGCTFYTGNNKEAVITGVSSGTLTFANNTFAISSETGIVTIKRVLNDVVLIPSPHTNIYKDYLFAQIDWFNRDYEDYNNGMARYNNAFREFENWYIKKSPIDKTAKIKNLWWLYAYTS